MATKSGRSIADRADIVWVDFTPTVGHEQSGRRPALVLTAALYNARSNLALVCPITSHAKGFATEVALPAELPVGGVVLSDHIRSIDWRSRGAQIVGRVPEDVMQEVLKRIDALLPR